MLDRFETFVSGISRCHRSIQKIKNAEMTEFGLRGTHVMCLFYLSRHSEGLTAAQLSALTFEDKAAVSRTLRELRSLDYITESAPETGRKYRAVIRLTDSGNKIAGKVSVLINRWVDSGGSGLTETEREIFYRALDKIADNLTSKSQKGL
ncbi:MAG: winged helix-turn-helix transcriptional regulator [Oscillospiraceae bacterium]|nr:winged helix-turn-helix transcriptional regulator [Oscillospiraceae bacterium]